MEVLAILFAAGIFVSLIWPEKQQPTPPKQEDLLVKALKELMKEGKQSDAVQGGSR